MTKLVWITPDAEKVIGYCARVSNPSNQDNPDVTRLLRYCVGHGHWSIFEQASMCVEIKTTRAIAAQILRHRSFAFQEFSQRYATVVEDIEVPAMRLAGAHNRQSSLPLPKVEELTKHSHLSAFRNVMCNSKPHAPLARVFLTVSSLKFFGQ